MNLSTLPALTLTNPAPAIESLLQSGKITAEQAALAGSTNRNSLFSLFLAEYQGAGAKADNYGYNAQDPYSALFKEEDDSADTGMDKDASGLYDAISGLMPVNLQYYQKTMGGADAVRSTLYDSLMNLF